MGQVMTTAVVECHRYVQLGAKAIGEPAPATAASSATSKAQQQAADVAMRFVRLHGLFFDRINIDQLTEISAAASKELTALLGKTL